MGCLEGAKGLPPMTASRMRSLKVPMPHPARFSCVALRPLRLEDTCGAVLLENGEEQNEGRSSDNSSRQPIDAHIGKLSRTRLDVHELKQAPNDV